MSLYYVGSGAESPQDLFYKRLNYRALVRGSIATTGPLVDFYVAEKQLYGKVDYDYNPMMLQQENEAYPPSRRKTFTTNYSSAGPTERYQSPAFVADAFMDMARSFDKAVATGQIPGGHKFLSKLKVYNAYENIDGRYRSYLNSYIEGVLAHVASSSLHITRMSHLLQFYEYVLLPKLSSTAVLTLSGFIKSSACSRLNTGLAIDIADLTLSNDDEKIEQFLRAPAWRFYTNAARAHGFMIDAHIPWRLVADIGSSQMLAYSRKYGMNTTEKILDMSYEPTYNKDFGHFLNFFLTLYNQITGSTTLAPRLCSDGTIRYESIPVKKYTFSSMIKEVSYEAFLRLYMKVRMQEQPTTFTEHERLSLVNECVSLSQSEGHQQLALKVFSTIINKTFDYPGSLSYIVKMRRASTAQLTGDVGGSVSKGGFADTSGGSTGGGGY